MSNNRPQEDMDKFLCMGGFDAQLSKEQKQRIMTKLAACSQSPSRAVRRRYFDKVYSHPFLRVAAVVLVVVLVGLGIWRQKTVKRNNTNVGSTPEADHMSQTVLNKDVGELIAVLQQGRFDKKLEAAVILTDIGATESIEFLERLSGDYYDHVPDNPFIKAAVQIKTRTRQKKSDMPRGDLNILSPLIDGRVV